MRALSRIGLVLGLVLAICWPVARANATACTAGCTQYVQTAAYSGHTVAPNLTGVASGGASIHIYACGSITGTFAPAVTDVQGSTYTVGQIRITTSKTCFVASAPNVSSGAHTITVDYGASATCSNCEAVSAEWPGEATSSLQDNWNAVTPSGQNAIYNTNSTTLVHCPATTTNANDHFEYVLFQEQLVAPTFGAPWALAFSIPANGWWVYYQTLAASGSVATDGITTGASSFNNNITCMANKLAGGGGSVGAGGLSTMGIGTP